MFTNYMKSHRIQYGIAFIVILFISIINYLHCALISRGMLLKQISISVADLMIVQSDQVWIFIPSYLFILWFVMKNDWQSNYLIRFGSRFELFNLQVCSNLIFTLVYTVIYIMICIFISSLFSQGFINFNLDYSQFYFSTRSLIDISFLQFMLIYAAHFIFRMVFIQLLFTMSLWTNRWSTVCFTFLSLYDLISSILLSMSDWNLLASNQYEAYLPSTHSGLIMLVILAFFAYWIGTYTSVKKEFI